LAASEDIRKILSQDKKERLVVKPLSKISVGEQMFFKRRKLKEVARSESESASADVGLSQIKKRKCVDGVSDCVRWNNRKVSVIEDVRDFHPKLQRLTFTESFDVFDECHIPVVSRACSFRIDSGALTDGETHRNIVEHLNNSPLLVTYTGHGSQNVWASSSLFNSSDAAGLSNNRLSFYLLMNCSNGYTNQPTGESLAKALFKAPNGAIAVWTSSGITQPGSQSGN